MRKKCYCTKLNEPWILDKYERQTFCKFCRHVWNPSICFKRRDEIMEFVGLRKETRAYATGLFVAYQEKKQGKNRAVTYAACIYIACLVQGDNRLTQNEVAQLFWTTDFSVRHRYKEILDILELDDFGNLEEKGSEANIDYTDGEV